MKTGFPAYLTRQTL